MRTRGSDQPKTVLVTHEQDIEQHNSQPSYQKLRTMVKRCSDQNIRIRNFEARNERIETGAPAKDRSKGKTRQRVKEVRDENRRGLAIPLLLQDHRLKATRIFFERKSSQRS